VAALELLQQDAEPRARAAAARRHHRPSLFRHGFLQTWI
jgi:hypothetical protein